MKCPKCKFYNICKGRLNETVENCVRFESAEQTNEEWFNGLPTETKARITHLVYTAGYRDGLNGAETIPLRNIMEWLKQPHKGK